MKYHPFQSDRKVLEQISKIFRETMTRKGILPKNPWKATRVHKWLAGMGCRMRPGCSHRRMMERPDTENYVNFEVACERSKTRIMGYRNDYRFMRVEIPHDLADKIMVLGCLPGNIVTVK